MSSPVPWEVYLAERFPGYLLPDSAREALPEAEADRFLMRLGGSPRELALLCLASAVAAHVKPIEAFALHELPELVRQMTPRAISARRVWQGRLFGRLDAPATLRRRLAGRSTEICARVVKLGQDRPEDRYVKSVSRRLASALGELGRAGVLGRSGWGASLPRCQARIDRLLAERPLRDVSDAPIDRDDERAALSSRRHPGYLLAAVMDRLVMLGRAPHKPESIARILADGALLPRDDSARFELAVLLRLLEALHDALGRRSPGRFTHHRTIIASGRRDVADFEREDGGHVRVFYDQACLDPGPCDRGVRRYLGQRGRLRPDVTLRISAPGRAERAVVIEVKLSTDPAYLAQGYEEAALYRAEYAEQLTGWPKAILVAPGPMAAPPRREDDVVAVGWDAWVPEAVIDGILDGA